MLTLRLSYDKALLEGAIEMAERNQPVIYTPFTLAGAMAPITVAGALVHKTLKRLQGLPFINVSSLERRLFMVALLLMLT